MLQTLLRSSRGLGINYFALILVLYLTGILSIQPPIGVAKPYSASPQRHVIYYYQNGADLSPLINNLNPATGKPYVTDINVAMVHIGPQRDGSPLHLNHSTPDDPKLSHNWEQLTELQKMGVRIFMVVGGNPPCCSFKALFNDWNNEYPALRYTLQEFHFNGIDLDVEDPVDLGQIQRLIDQLSEDFGSGFLITLAPVSTDLTAVPGHGMAGFNYKVLYTSSVRSKIAWFNVQFYNGWGHISSTSDYDKAIRNGFPPDKVVANMLCNQDDGGGYVDINTVANSVIKPLVNKYPNFAGVSCWEYYNAQPGGTSNPWRWSQVMTQAMGLPIKRLPRIIIPDGSLPPLPSPVSTPQATSTQPPQPTPLAQPTQPSWSFPCSDIQSSTGHSSQPSENVISKDWLSGDVADDTNGNTVSQGGHFLSTYVADTYGFPQISILFPYAERLAFLLITPSVILLGYQIMLGASSFRHAGALEGFSRVLLSALAVTVSFELVQMLIQLEGSMTKAILLLHAQHPFPQTTVNGTAVQYTLSDATAPGEPATSYRAIVVPMSRWGCALNDFIGVFSVPFLENTLASVIPLFGGLAHLAGRATTISDLIHHIGKVVLVVLSILLWGQVFLRILLINYYILTAPLVFGCWALPGEVGQNVVRLWCKGFLTMLFVQVVQLFILTTLPLLLPALPQISPDNMGILQGPLLQFPPILALCLTLIVPRFLGASMAKALGIAGGMIVAVGTIASQIR